MVMKWTAVCLMALAMLGSYCDAQWHEIYKPTANRYQKPAQQPAPAPPPPQEPQQTKQTFETPLTWTFPEDPQSDPQPDVPFEQRFPISAVSVAVECRANHARVEVKKDMFGRGFPINSAALTLGNCLAIGEDSVAQVLVFETALHDCGSRLMVGIMEILVKKKKGLLENILTCNFVVVVVIFISLPDDRRRTYLHLHPELQSQTSGLYPCGEEHQCCCNRGMPLPKVCRVSIISM